MKRLKANGFYFGDGKIEFPEPYVSVTKVLSGLSPANPLINWASKTTAQIILDNPSIITVDEATLAFRNHSKIATTRGTGVHNIYKEWILDGKTPPKIDQYKGYIKGLEKFIFDHNPTHLHKDLIVYSHKHKFAGELDSIDRLSGGAVWLLDLKTGNTYPEHTIQLSAYYIALKEMGIDIDRMGILNLPGEGNYNLSDREPREQAFLKQLAFWNEWYGPNARIKVK